MPRFELTEWKSLEIPKEALTSTQLHALLSLSEKTSWFNITGDIKRPDLYILQAKNHVGQSVLGVDGEETIEIIIQPKISLFSLMDWWAWSGQSVIPSQHTIQLETVTDLLEQLCFWLACDVLNLAKKGLTTEYVKQQNFVSNIKGQIDIQKSMPAFYRGKAELFCKYDERTVNTLDNQILLWTLYQARKWAFRSEDIRQKVNQAYRVLSSTIELKPVNAKVCFGRSYTRLNVHYKNMHQWCGMILSHCTFSEKAGSQLSRTFMLDISKIFEQAVANYMKKHTPLPSYAESQVLSRVSSSPDIAFLIDLALFKQGQCISVIDTKYKDGNEPSRNDVFQILSYALSQKTINGILLYPIALTQKVDSTVGDIRIRTLTFDMSKTVEAAGYDFIESLELSNDLQLISNY